MHLAGSASDLAKADVNVGRIRIELQSFLAVLARKADLIFICRGPVDGPVRLTYTGPGASEPRIDLNGAFKAAQRAFDIFRVVEVAEEADALQIALVGCTVLGAMGGEPLAVLIAELNLEHGEHTFDHLIFQRERIGHLAGDMVGPQDVAGGVDQRIVDAD